VLGINLHIRLVFSSFSFGMKQDEYVKLNPEFPWVGGGTSVQEEEGSFHQQI
jgi:hypothetical protein